MFSCALPCRDTSNCFFIIVVVVVSGWVDECFAFSKTQYVLLDEDKLQIIDGLINFEHNGLLFGSKRFFCLRVACIICIGWSKNLAFSSI